MIDNLKIHIHQSNFGRLQQFTIYHEDINYEHNGLIHVAKPIQLEMQPVEPAMEYDTDPTLKVTTRSLVSMFKSFEQSMQLANLVVPKTEKVECKDETIAVLKNTIDLLRTENDKLHSMNSQLMEVIKSNV